VNPRMTCPANTRTKEFFLMSYDGMAGFKASLTATTFLDALNLA
jgi:hypothetical protein